MNNPQFHMPAEWGPHSCTWMAWPSAPYTLGTQEHDRLAAYGAWSSVANAIVNFEPVKMLARVEDLAIAKSFLDPKIELIACELNDGWMRDIGPTFVKTSDQNLIAVDWQFNGWGAQGNWANWDLDDQVASVVAKIQNVPATRSWMVNEGGGIHVNGAGKVLVTETVQLGKGRNPSATKEQVEVELNRLLGANEVIWFKRGLTRDYEDYGTQGHIDIVACFVNETTVLFHDQQDQSHPDFLVSTEVKQTILDAGLTPLPIPAPKILRDEVGWVDYSYVNHYLVNGGVILCAFDDENDEKARAILQDCYPDREIILVDAREIFARGGGIHCITQQQPI